MQLVFEILLSIGQKLFCINFDILINSLLTKSKIIGFLLQSNGL